MKRVVWVIFGALLMAGLFYWLNRPEAGTPNYTDMTPGDGNS
jgi:hypothetical protein